MTTRHRVREKFRHYRTLLVIIAITALVWLVWAMSDIQTYPTQVRVEMTGIDTARYAIVKADTVLNLEVESDGFSAMRRYMKLNRNRVQVNMSKGDNFSGGKAVSVRAFIPSLKEQLGLPSALKVDGGQDSLRLWIAERKRKGFVPQLRDVSFEFTDQYGLSGEPILKPDTVWLYGSETSLDKIDELYTEGDTIKGIKNSDTVMLELNPTWLAYSDLRVSTSKVELIIPTEAYTEKEFIVPVMVENSDTSINVKLYPEKVAVTLWVPMQEHARLSENQLTASIELQEKEDKAQVMIKNFPSSVRVKQIKPKNVQYVIIK